MNSLKSVFKCSLVCIFIAGLFFVTGCSTKMGSFNEKTHFSFPNSNVTPLGNVQSSFKKTGFLFPPSISGEDVKSLLDDAVSQKAGADLVINYSVDTKFTSWVVLPIYTMEMTLSGEAANMEVGRQELEEYLKKIDY